MKRLLCATIYLIAFLIVSPGWAATVYYAQSAAGDESGSSCGNAKAKPATISDSDARICGTVTPGITIGANNTHITFEADAKISAATWTDATAAISCSSKSGVVIDGGSNGIIEATDNGSPNTTTPAGTKGNQNRLVGVTATQCDSIEVKNLHIHDLYVRVPDSDDSWGTTTSGYSVGIKIESSDSPLIHNNTIHDVYYGIDVFASAHDTVAGSIYANTFSNISTGIVVAIGNQCKITGDFLIYGNSITDMHSWDGCWSSCTVWEHNDGIHIWNPLGDATHAIESLKIYNNNFVGDFGSHTTSWIYLEDYWLSAYLYNNLLVTTAEKPAGGFIGLTTKTTGANAYVYNNTIVGAGTDTAGGIGVYTSGNGTMALDLKNNLIKNTYVAIRKMAGATLTSNYNSLYLYGNPGAVDDTAKNLTQWQALGYDTPNSITADPSIDANYAPDAADDPIVGAGADLSATFTTDKNGVTRTVPWDIGAYKYGTDPTNWTVTFTTTAPCTSSLAAQVVADGATGSATLTVPNGYKHGTTSSGTWSGNTVTTAAITADTEVTLGCESIKIGGVR